MLVGSHNGRIDHGVFVVRVFRKLLKDRFQDSAGSPSAEPRMHHAEIAESLRQIAPRNPGAIAVQHSFHKQTIVHARTTHCPIPPR